MNNKLGEILVGKKKSMHANVIVVFPEVLSLGLHRLHCVS